MRRIIVLIVLLGGVPAAAQVVATTDRGVVVAHDGIVELFDARLRRVWSAPALERVTTIATGDDRIALLDAWSNEVRVVMLADGSGTTLRTGETPVAAVFRGRNLIVLERDARKLSTVGGMSIDVAADSSLLRATGDRIYVYSRAEGELQEIDARADLRLRRVIPVPRFAADMEVDGKTAYLLYPREGKLASVDLETLVIETTAAGAAPADLAMRRGSALSAPLIAIADPAAKRVWTVEGAQSLGAAFGRGFVRGLIGLGLFRPRSAEFPTGVDRIVSAADVIAAYDSSSRTLYRVDRGRGRAVAQDVAPQAFAIFDNRLVIWRGNGLSWAG